MHKLLSVHNFVFMEFLQGEHDLRSVEFSTELL